MEKGEIKTGFLLTIVILLIVIICIMGYFVYTIKQSNEQNNKEIEILKADIQNIQNDKNTNVLTNTTANTITNTMTNTLTNTVADTNVPKTDKELAIEVAQKFVEAVNAKDWETAKKCSYNGDNMVSELKKYNVRNMKVDYTTLETNPNTSAYGTMSYYTTCNYDCDVNIKDYGMGKIFTVDKIDNSFKVVSFSATGN